MKRLIAIALVGACLGVAAPAGASTHHALERTHAGTWVICQAGARNPKVYYGAFGLIGLVVDTDWILCDVPGVIYSDRLTLFYEDSIPIAESLNQWPGTPMVLTPLGYYTSNTTHMQCFNKNATDWYGQQLVGVQWGIYNDTNYPDGYFSNTVHVGCGI